MNMRSAAAALLLALLPASANAATLRIPFDFSRHAIAIDVTVRGAPAFMLLDTGVDPSVIDLGRAKKLNLKINLRSASEVSGVGSAKHAQGYDAVIDGLAIEGRKFPPLAAGASDLGAASQAYGRTLDGILGFSFLKNEIVLIDYASKTVSLLDRASDAAAATKSCRLNEVMPMHFLTDENWPLISALRLGQAVAPVTLDTGSNGGISLYQGALALPGVRAALRKAKQSSSSGLRGSSTMTTYVFDAPLGFGPFRLPAGEIVTLRDDKGSAATRLGNVGNRIFAALTPLMLLDYRDRKMIFYASCR